MTESLCFHCRNSAITPEDWDEAGSGALKMAPRGEICATHEAWLPRKIEELEKMETDLKAKKYTLNVGEPKAYKPSPNAKNFMDKTAEHDDWRR